MKEKSTETISVKIIVTNIQQNSAVVKTVERLSQSNRYFNFLFVYGMERTESTKIRKSENWDDTKKGGRRQMHYQQRTIISFQPERKFRPITKIFRARWKHDCTGRPSSTDQMPPSELLIMLQKLTKTWDRVSCWQGVNKTHTHNKAGHLMKK